ncbi:hypothetical protein FPZ49_10995 [Paenibacillus cremeus]|uniref:Uncharacterized protein n=2 Tax=Paenibacillus cremeus TaxID=2163881 RepID=A0A559KD18_9BACL|nr:hypothetical protein FPZ49_10995 [Paenibacillus cremeus]
MKPKFHEEVIKVQVGDKVYLKAVGNNARGRKEVYIREDIISKVGRKYFEVGDGLRPLKFRIEDKQQKMGGYIADWQLYFSKQEILDEEEVSKLQWEIRKVFDTLGKIDLTLDQLRRIKTIISE